MNKINLLCSRCMRYDKMSFSTTTDNIGDTLKPKKNQQQIEEDKPRENILLPYCRAITDRAKLKPYLITAPYSYQFKCL